MPVGFIAKFFPELNSTTLPKMKCSLLSNSPTIGKPLKLGIADVKNFIEEHDILKNGHPALDSSISLNDLPTH